MTPSLALAAESSINAQPPYPWQRVRGPRGVELILMQVEQSAALSNSYCQSIRFAAASLEPVSVAKRHRGSEMLPHQQIVWVSLNIYVAPFN